MLSIFAEYQNVVTSAVAAAEVARTAVELVGIAAYFAALVVWFVIAVYEASKPLLPGVSPVVVLGSA